MIYRDRAHAANALADALAAWRGRRPLVAAIPRGAVSMGRILAERLDGDLDVVLVRKLRAPGNPELAVGSVDESGWTFLSPWAEAIAGTREYLQREIQDELAVTRARRARYTPGRGPLAAEGRVVIVVDDGLATGATMVAALHAMRGRHPARLICAVPVGSSEAVALVGRYADEVVCLQVPPTFHAVGQWYARFEQVDDEEVVSILRDAVPRAPHDRR
jgi:predicted phosphoribosyltransferase